MKKYFVVSDVHGGSRVKYSKELKFISNSDGTCFVYGIVACTDIDIIIPPVSPYGDRVTSIGNGAFSYCSGLTSITIPDSVTRIGDYAFYGCSGLTSITIPDSVTSIGDWAFDDCKGLTSITIPNSVTSIGANAFSGCIGLTSITIPDSVTSIGGYAFFGCIGLTSITIPDSVTSIGDWAFEECSGLISITIPDSVTSIGDWAFDDCKGLTSITIPNSVTSIGANAFSGCSNLTSAQANYKAFSIKNGKLKCRNKVYTVGEKSPCRGDLVPCENGIHYCTNIFDIFNYYSGEYGVNFVIGICDVSDENIGHYSDSKRCARWIIPKKILTREEVIDIMNGKSIE